MKVSALHKNVVSRLRVITISLRWNTQEHPGVQVRIHSLSQLMAGYTFLIEELPALAFMGQDSQRLRSGYIVFFCKCSGSM